MKGRIPAICAAGILIIAGLLPTGVAHARTSTAGRQAARAAAPTAADIVATAKAHLGDRYADIGNSPATGFSCIGFVNYVFAQNGVSVPFNIPSAWNSAPHVAMNALMPGDVLFFSNTVFAGLSHVAIYIGAGEMIGADSFAVGVTTERLSDNYWTAHYTGATRPLALSGTALAPGANNQPTVTAPPTATPVSGGFGATASPTATPSSVGQSNNRFVAPTATVTPAIQVVATAPSGTLLRPLARTVGLYSGPGYGYMLIASVDPGSLLTTLLGLGGWYSVRQGDIYGWVSASDVAPASAVNAKATPAAQAVPEATPTQVFSRAVATTTVSGLSDLYVVQGPLWVRRGPSKSYSQIGYLLVGTRLQVHQLQADWAFVSAPGNLTGWVARQYLGQAPPVQNSRAADPISTAAPAAPATIARVTTAALNVRAEPDSRAPAITKLFAGETVQVLARRAGWDQVMLRRGTIGWANATWLADQSDNGFRGDGFSDGSN